MIDNWINIKIEDVNDQVENNLKEFIVSCENNYKDQIEKVVEHINENKNLKFILLAGPSSSGKTTTANLIVKHFEKYNIVAHVVSLDDFFVERDQTPMWPDGKPNYESYEAIDWVLFDKCIKQLMQNLSSLMPTFNFIDGKKYMDKTISLNANEIIIFEGLHALNPCIDKYIPVKNSAKVYIAPHINYIFNKKTVLNGKQMRFFRRMIRGVNSRGTSPVKSLDFWQQVLYGEELYIDPFKSTADFYINSAHPYEMCVYRNIIKNYHLEREPLFKELLEPLNLFEQLDKSAVPADSVLQEFI